jgi:hypothetical protein
MKILPATRFKDPKESILTLKMLGSRMWFCKIIPEAGSNFKEANKTLIIVWGREKLLRDLETISASTESTD